VLTASALIRKGYFPKELPPCFTTADIADLFDVAGQSWHLDKSPTECARHNLARLGGTRRPLSIPNPRSYVRLSLTLQTHWNLIDAHLRSEKLAISRPVVTRTAERAVRPEFQQTVETLRARQWRGQRFVLQADVSQCYASLYTHAISWALHSKVYAKKNRGSTDGDEIDRAMRACTSGQTVGIPVGPDASYIVAEMVLTSVDALFKSQIPSLRGFRYLDDYEAAFATRSEAEQAQASLEGALGDFELALNPFKTRVLELPQPYKATWKKDLAAFPIRDDTPRKRLNDIVSLFSKAAEVASEFLGALTYVLRMSIAIEVDETSWPTFQSLVWNAVSVEPTTMSLALDLLMAKSEEAELPVDKAPATEVLEALINRHAPVRNASEVAWALWAAIVLEVDLTEDSARAIGKMDDDFVALVALDARARGRFPSGGIDTALWETILGGDALTGAHWLLAYEGALKQWLPVAEQVVKSDPFFGLLRSRGVRFYDVDPDRAPFTGPSAPPPGAPFPDSYA
jgi:hypothetical protein